MQLIELALIQTGIYAATRQTGNVAYLQTNQFESDGSLAASPFPYYLVGDEVNKHLLSEGDILFAAKGARNFAWVYTSDIGKAVASSSFFVIKIAKKMQTQILPEYLAWYINHPKVLTGIKHQALGTSIPSITKEVLADTSVILPPVQKQQQVVKLQSLANQQRQLYGRLQDLHKTYMQELLFNHLS